MSALSRFMVLVTALVVTAGITLVASTPANAFASLVRDWQGADYASINPSTKWVEVCDMEADGHGVYGRFVYGSGPALEVPDTNGSAAGCGNTTVPSTTYRFDLCERQTVGATCSQWVQLQAGKITEYNHANYGSINPDTHWVEVCDLEDDFVSAYGEFKDAIGHPVATITDMNGVSGGCGNGVLLNAVTFRICEPPSGTTNGCSDWVEFW